MKLFLLIFIIININNAKIIIDITADSVNPAITPSGEEIHNVKHRDMRKLFFIDKETIEEYASVYFNNTKPNKVLYSATVKKSSPDTENEDTSDVPQDISAKVANSDLYKRFNWEPVKIKTSVKSAKIKNIKEGIPVQFSKSYMNPTNETINIDAGVQMPVAITLETSWYTTPIDVSLDYNFVYEINVNLNEESGTSYIKHTTPFGTPTKIHEFVNIGRNNYNIDLHPGQAVTSKFSAKVCNLSMKATVVTNVSGNLAVNFKELVGGKHWWGPRIEDVLAKANFTSESPIEDNLLIRLDYYYDVKVEVFDKKTGQQL